jgi:hypothetical protein
MNPNCWSTNQIPRHSDKVYVRTDVEPTTFIVA